jgi:hypothetical protein
MYRSDPACPTLLVCAGAHPVEGGARRWHQWFMHKTISTKCSRRARPGAAGALAGVFAALAFGCVDGGGEPLTAPVRDLREATIQTPDGPRQVTYEVVDGQRIVEGDIVLPDEMGEGDPHKAYAIAGRVWPNNRIPYEIDPALPDQRRVEDAIAHYHRQTNVRLVPRNGEDAYVRFVPGDVCQATVGRAGGRQHITLAPGCDARSVLHEIGHTVGFWHEQSRSDRDDHVVIHWENIEEGEEYNFRVESGTRLGAYDLESVMQYDSYAFSATGEPTITRHDGSVFSRNLSLSAGDIQALAQRHPHRSGPSPAACRTAPDRRLPRRRADLAEVWEDRGLASFAVHPSSGASFAAPADWAVRDGGFGTGVRWSAGDFDGDGDQDLVGAWNDGGHSTLTVRRANGSSFSHEHWRIRAGGWMDSTQWLPGDFDGDGLTDLGVVWNDGGQVSIAVYRSTGSSFEWPRQWVVRAGGWGDSVRWTVGNFNGDRFDDVVGIWNDRGQNTLTVRPSNGTTFGQEHWRVRAGGWMASTQWLAGDFDGNGLTDVAAVWNEGGQASFAVYRSAGASFGWPEPWVTRDGAWGDIVKWTAGDVDADGRSDIIAAWDNGGRTTLTARRSTGGGFGHEHWSINRVDWQEGNAFCAGSFDGN